MSEEFKLYGSTTTSVRNVGQGKENTQAMIDFLQEQLDCPETQAMTITAVIARESNKFSVTRSEYTRTTGHGYVNGVTTTLNEKSPPGANLWLYDTINDRTYTSGENNPENDYFAYCAGACDEVVVTINNEDQGE